jgi:hypothetical protein
LIALQNNKELEPLPVLSDTALDDSDGLLLLDSSSDVGVPERQERMKTATRNLSGDTLWKIRQFRPDNITKLTTNILLKKESRNHTQRKHSH